jgi:hypothetical protein
MQFSPRRSWLYRSRQRAVTLLVITAFGLALATSRLEAQGPIIQYGQKGKVDKGPRALGLVQIPAKGKARLVPIAIMVDGKFYDADSYKAAPVPMALDFGVVYEAFHAGVSQGILTISQPGQLNHTWIAEGTWLPAGLRPREKSKKYSPPVIEDSEGPPVLHRRKGSDANEKDKDNDKEKDKEKGEDAKAKDIAKSTDAKDKAPSDQTKDDQKAASASPSAGTSTPAKPANTAPTKSDDTRTSSSEEPIADPNRPRLRRGRPDPSARRDVYTKFEALPVPAPASAVSAPTKPAGTAADSSSLAQVTIFPAISDAGGPEPRPYVYDVKPTEEAVYRQKMLDLAAAQFRAAAVLAKDSLNPTLAHRTRNDGPSSKTTGKIATKFPKPAFEDVNVRFFDLSNSNEPVLVLSAKARPANSNASENANEPKEIMLIARTNLEGEVKKLFFSQTDSRHLDQTPRMELIDAVDADGDGRGELLFRRVFDTGSAYAIYRVTSDRLWPLFEGTP